MDLQFLAISDTHVGEDTSLLSFPRGRQHLWRTLLEKFGNGQKFNIKELILVGDIPDTALSSISQAITQTNAFIQTMGSAANIDKVIYIPGNHDHTLWTDYIRLRSNNPKLKYRITPPQGEFIVEKNKKCDDPGSEYLLTLFFGYPFGPAWTKIQDQNTNRKFDFIIANPLYAKEYNNRTYIFTHGTHFKSVVTAPVIIKKIIDYSQLDKLLANLNIESDCDVSKATSLENLEEIVAPFVDSLWISSKNNPNSRSDKLWYLFSVLSKRFEKIRKVPLQSDRFNFSNFQDVSEDRIIKFNGNNSIKLLKIYFLNHLFSFLKDYRLLKENLTFVYGDTHDGGWGEIEEEYIDPPKINVRIFNCGAWVVHDEKNHPPCHVFAVDNPGNEYLLDVSFKDVKMLDTSLLKLAATDFENHSESVSRLLRFVLDRF